jgi:hypothetical protein
MTCGRFKKKKRRLLALLLLAGINLVAVVDAFSSRPHPWTRGRRRGRHFPLSSPYSPKKTKSTFVPFLRNGISPMWLLAGTTRTSAAADIQHIGDELGSGSYGTVHLVSTRDGWCIGKRAWTVSDFLEQRPASSNATNVKQRAYRCLEYWRTERHCYDRFMNHHHHQLDTTTSNASALPIAPYRGTALDEFGREWMLFGVVLAKGSSSSSSSSTLPTTPLAKSAIAPSLQQMMEQDRVDHQQNQKRHHLYRLSQALGIADDEVNNNPLADTLDVVMSQVLAALAFIHSHKIVHRGEREQDAARHRAHTHTHTHNQLLESFSIAPNSLSLSFVDHHSPLACLNHQSLRW